MMGFFDWNIKVDFEDKIIKIKNVSTPKTVAALIEKEFNSRSADAPLELLVSDMGATLQLLNGWKFDAKTISIMKQKDDRRYRHFRTSDSTSITSTFKRI